MTETPLRPSPHARVWSNDGVSGSRPEQREADELPWNLGNNFQMASEVGRNLDERSPRTIPKDAQLLTRPLPPHTAPL